MHRMDPVPSPPGLREMLFFQNAETLKRMLTLLPDVHLKAPRKGELVDTLRRMLLGPDLPEVWQRLNALEKSAVAEATHRPDGNLDLDAIRAKYGQKPVFDSGEENEWQRRPTRIRLFLYPVADAGWHLPADLRARLLEFVPAPPSAQLASRATLPSEKPRTRTTSRYNDREQTREYQTHEVPLVQRMTEPAALQDLRTTLRLIEQEKITVSAATSLPSKASMNLLTGLLREGDFFEPLPKLNEWDPEIGPIKAFSWPLLVQAAGFATARDHGFTLSKRGRQALAEAPAGILRELWNAWLNNGIFDEFSRIDTIKGQKANSGNHFTPPAGRRTAISNGLSQCPVGEWVATAEFSRYLQAAGFRFEVTRDASSLYLCDPKYGSLGYGRYGGWNILQERYLLCFLFEYAAPLGIIDVAYEHPAGARPDYSGQWGGENLIFLSRYDGLKYFRLTPLGAFVLGLAPGYEPQQTRSGVSLSVLPGRRIQLNDGDLSPEETLLLELFAERETDRTWRLDEARSIRAVESGSRVGELRSFLTAGDPQPLPETVESFLSSVEQRGSACVFQGRCLLIECTSPHVAETISQDARSGRLCRRTGDRGLIVPVDQEEAFRTAINGLGFGMPRV